MRPVVTFWGTRGSIPTSGPAFAETGGNTSCIQISLSDHVVLLDAGTGIREAGEALVDDERDITILLSHPHWDHIQGFPFFLPLYKGHRNISLVAPGHPEWLDLLLEQIDGVRFPVASDALNCTISRSAELNGALGQAGIQGTTIETNHPGGGLGFRLAFGDRSLVYLTDNELAPPGEVKTSFETFAQFAAGTDLLIHDAQYIADDYPDKAGWGHSTMRQVFRLAEAARVSRVALFHHDPATTDKILAERVAHWQAHAEGRFELFAASDGLSLVL